MTMPLACSEPSMKNWTERHIWSIARRSGGSSSLIVLSRPTQRRERFVKRSLQNWTYSKSFQL